jgi:hypothetical protein
MKLTFRTARRGLAVSAVASVALAAPAAAVAAPGATGAPAAFTARVAAAAPAHCPAGSLQAWLGVPGDGYAGGAAYQLELSNVSARPCTLYGYPGVSAVGPGGHQLGSAAGRDGGDPVRLITLGRGATAHVLLRITDVGNYPAASCHPATAVALRVFPPNDFGALQLPFPFRACSARGPVYLHVRATVTGTGIPGYSS